MENSILPNDYEKTLELIVKKIKKTQQKAIISTKRIKNNFTNNRGYWKRN